MGYFAVRNFSRTAVSCYILASLRSERFGKGWQNLARKGGERVWKLELPAGAVVRKQRCGS